MDIKKFDMKDIIDRSSDPGFEACRWLMPIAGGAPEGEEGDEKKDEGDISDDDIEKLLTEGQEKKDEAGDEKDEADEKDDEGDEKDDAGDEGEEVKIDPKDDIEITLPGGKKAKLSEVLAWQKQATDYTQKTQKLAADRKQLSALQEMSDFLKKNPKKLEKVLSILEEAEEAAAEVKADGGDKGEVKDAVAEVLKKLDMTNPMNVLIKKLYEGNERILKEIDQANLRSKKAVEQGQQAEHAELVKKAQDTLHTTLDSAVKASGLEEGEEQKLVRQLTLSFLKDNPKEYEGEEDFTATIKATVTKMTKLVGKVGEARLAKYLKSKSPNRVARGGDGGDGKPAVKEKGLDGAGLQSMIEDELTAAIAEKK